MAFEDELKELYDLARRALVCQAELGHKEIIFEARAASAPLRQASAMMASPEKEFTTDPADQLSLLATDQPALEESQFKDLSEHRLAICACTKCPLGYTRTNFVYGVGNPESKIMFVGEAPGFEEDRQGEPFVGRAGKLLDKIIEAMGLRREDVYIANILKCRPPENRDPQPDEMKECLPYLIEQIRLIKPRFICALGRIAAHGLLETSAPLGQLRGKWHRFQGIPLIVTYHPAALLRFAQYKRPTWEDMQKLMAEYGRLDQNR
jgi:uracil-DNA glycosylase family 4